MLSDEVIKPENFAHVPEFLDALSSDRDNERWAKPYPQKLKTDTRDGFSAVMQTRDGN